jgi:hypothetical protein
MFNNLTGNNDQGQDFDPVILPGYIGRTTIYNARPWLSGIKSL